MHWKLSFQQKTVCESKKQNLQKAQCNFRSSSGIGHWTCPVSHLCQWYLQPSEKLCVIICRWTEVVQLPPWSCKPAYVEVARIPVDNPSSKPMSTLHRSPVPFFQCKNCAVHNFEYGAAIFFPWVIEAKVGSFPRFLVSVLSFGCTAG